MLALHRMRVDRERRAHVSVSEDLLGALRWHTCFRHERAVSLRGFERAAGNLLASALRNVDPGSRIIVLGKRSGTRIGAEEAIIHAGAGDAIALLVLVARLLRMHLSGCGGGKKGQHCGRDYGRARLINRRFHEGISLLICVAGFATVVINHWWGHSVARSPSVKTLPPPETALASTPSFASSYKNQAP